MRKMMWVEWERGANLSKSQQRPGHYSPLTRDRDKNLVGQVTLSDVDEEDFAASRPLDFDPYDSDERDRVREVEEWAELMAQVSLLVEELVPIILEELVPRIRRWWDVKALPAVQSSKESIQSRVARKRKGGRRVRDAEVVTFVDGSADNQST